MLETNKLEIYSNSSVQIEQFLNAHLYIYVKHVIHNLM